MLVIFALSLFFIIFAPSYALAWGPATHLELGLHVLNNLKDIAGPASALIESYPYDFLYGSISADIVLGKNLVEELKHCHNWRNGFKLLKRASCGEEKAFAYGYLCHLAADTVAHNHYIPEMMIRSFSARTLRHIYWEMRFDALADRRVWQLPKRIIKEIRPENDRLLDSIIEDAPLSFRTNKTIFSSMLGLQRFQQWHRMLSLLSSSSRWTLEKPERDRFFNASYDAVKDLLANAQRAECVKKDPTGKHSLDAAKGIRKRLKAIRWRGKGWQDAMENALRWLRF